MRQLQNSQYGPVIIGFLVTLCIAIGVIAVIYSIWASY